VTGESTTAPPSSGPDVARAHTAIDAVWRIEQPRIVAALARMVRDVGLAEDLAQEALIAALFAWPRDGIPTNPGAWLVATARNRAIDQLRRAQGMRDRVATLGHEERQRQLDEPGVDLDQLQLEQDFAGDDLLRLLFATCHPALSREARAALTLRLLGGLTVAEIARAFLTTEPTVHQRIGRAKKALAKVGGGALEIPSGDERAARVASVCEVVYLIFNEGYAATSGAEWTRPALCHEAMRLGRTLCAIAPTDSEVLGLTALMELQASRLPARRAPDGAPILLLDQDRTRWDRMLIRHGLATLDAALDAHARTRVGATSPGPYALQAAIAACHARAARPDDTDWNAIAALYGLLVQAVPSPVIELNRAVAVSMADGPAPALELVDSIADLPVLRDYHLLPSVRGDLLRKLGREDEARTEFARAAQMATNEPERALLQRRADGHLD
jgi:RNA polymerase sigma factor (sigma-70 family)